MSDERTIFWVGGWASDLACWEQPLRPLLAGFQLRFLSAHAFLKGTAPLAGLLEAAPRDAILAGWSLGALLVEDLLRSGRVPHGMPVVRICPFLDFCDPSGPWRPMVLRRMARRLNGDAHGVLEDFAERAGIPSGPLRRSWFDQASAIGEYDLAEGLGTLEALRLPAPWADAEGGFLVSRDDAVSPPCPTPEDRTIVLPEGSGHVPFLNQPEAFALALRGLVG